MAACNISSLFKSPGIELGSFFFLYTSPCQKSHLSAVQPQCTSSAHRHLTYLFLCMAPQKSTIYRWQKIILISENCPVVLAKIHTKGVMCIKNSDELMLFIISDGKVSATLCLVRWGKMLYVSWLRSLTSGTVTPSPNVFTVLTDFNFFFIFFSLIGSLTVLPSSALVVQRKMSLDSWKIDFTGLDGAWLKFAVSCHLGRLKFGPSFQVNCRWKTLPFLLCCNLRLWL